MMNETKLDFAFRNTWIVLGVIAIAVWLKNADPINLVFAVSDFMAYAYMSWRWGA